METGHLGFNLASLGSSLFLSNYSPLTSSAWAPLENIFIRAASLFLCSSLMVRVPTWDETKPRAPINQPGGCPASLGLLELSCSQGGVAGVQSWRHSPLLSSQNDQEYQLIVNIKLL